MCGPGSPAGLPGKERVKKNKSLAHALWMGTKRWICASCNIEISVGRLCIRTVFI